MQTVGIVCEYNPFHKGHLYHLQETCRVLGEDTTTVCVMSGDFVQRGEAAVFDKFARAEAACLCGADLVVELPLPWCLSSAEGFAFGAVSILAALGCETLSFGSESGDVTALRRLAAFSANPASQEYIYSLMDSDASLSYPRARQLAAEKALGGTASFFKNPNDILAVEYLKAIDRVGTGILPLAIRRAGEDHDSEAEGEYISALHIRELLKSGQDPASWVPESALCVFRREMQSGHMRDEKLLEIALLSRLYQLKPECFDVLPDAGGGAGRRLYQTLWQSNGVEQTVKASATKRYTSARMRRMLICAALGICAEDTKGTPPYIRVLAMGKKGRALLARLRGNTLLPVINKSGDVKMLGIQAEKVFNQCARAHELYRLACPMAERCEPGEDWRRTGVIV